ncbi:hypothetical protein ACLUWM_09770 [Limosilactobacillus mucosae]
MTTKQSNTQCNTIAQPPMTAKAIKAKYKDLTDQYPAINVGQVPYRTLTHLWQFYDLNAKQLGMLGLLAYWSAYTIDAEEYNVPRISPLWIAKRLGYAEKQASRHVKQIKQLLLELHQFELIKIVPDHATKTQTILIDHDQDHATGFSKLYAPTIQTILDQSKGMTTLYRVALYVAIRTATYETGPLNVPVMDYPPSYLAKVLGTSPSTIQRHLAWLRDHGAICWYQCVMNNVYHTVKYIYSDPVNVAALVPWIMDHIDKDPSKPDPDAQTSWIAKVVA